MSAPPPTGPIHTLRIHISAITSLYISSHSNARIYSGDSSGVIAITSCRTLRPVAKWQAHKDGILGVEEDERRGRVVTQARDNKLYIWSLVTELPSSSRIGGGPSESARTQEGELARPEKLYEMDVNALNFCRFSLLGSGENESLIAIPNLVESEVADIWSLPSLDRIHAGVGQDGRRPNFWSSEGMEGRKGNGIIMSLHLYTLPISGPSLPSTSSSTLGSELRLLTAYESGNVTLRRYVKPKNSNADKSVEGKGWEVIWDVRLHKESIMGMRVSRDNSFALTISADHLIGKYILNSSDPPDKACVAHKGKQAGNAAVAIRDDGRVCAVAGWDGHIRLYSTKNMKPLGTLKYHKVSCQALEFAHSGVTSGPANEEKSGGEGRETVGVEAEDDEGDAQDEERRKRWLVAGGKDHRVSIWELISFEKSTGHTTTEKK